MRRMFAGALLAALAAAGCRSVPLNPGPVHDPRTGPSRQETWITLNREEYQKTSGNTCVSHLRNRDVFGGLRSSRENRRLLHWEYLETLGGKDAYYLEVRDAGDRVLFEDVVLYGGGDLVAYRDDQAEVLLTDRP